MLQAIRSRIKSAVVSILVFLLVASFALWGLEHVGSDVVSPGTDVATVNGESIYPDALFEQVRRDSLQFERAFGRQLTSSELYSFGIVGRASEALITQSAIRHMAHDVGFAAGDDLAKRSIAETPSFRGTTGAFSADRFHSALRQAGFSENSYLTALKSEIARDFVTAPALHIPEVPRGLTEIFTRAAGETRAAARLTIDASKLPITSVTEADIKTWYTDHLETYSSPETRTLTIVPLAQSSVEVSDDALQELYDDMELEIPETRDVEIALFSDEAAARALLERIALAANESPLEVIAESLSPVSVTTFSGLKREDGVPEITNAVFEATATGGVGPIQTPFGWHVGRLNQIVPHRTPSFEESRDEVFEVWWQENGAQRLFELGNDLEDALASGAHIEGAAADLGLQVFDVSDVERSGTLPGELSDDIRAEVPDFAEFLPIAAEAGFGQETGETSALIEVSDFGALVVRTDAIAPSAPLPLEQVRNRVVADFKADHRANIAKDLAASIKTDVESGVSLEASFNSLNSDIRAAMTYSPDLIGPRVGWSGMVPPQEVTLLFDLTTDSPINHVASADGETLYLLQSVSWPGLDEKQQAEQVSQAGDQWRATLLRAVLSSIRDTTEVDINSAAISGLFPVSTEESQ